MVPPPSGPQSRCGNPACGRPIERQATGRPARYCSGSCRQAAGRERLRLAEAERARPLGADPAVADQYRGATQAAVLREVALDPGADFHFNTGRGLASRLGYDDSAVGALPDRAVESFAGSATRSRCARWPPGEHVVDVGSGAGFDSFIAAGQVGPAAR